MPAPDAPDPEPGSNAIPTRRSPLRLTGRAAAVACVAGGTALGLARGQHRWQVRHPHPLPLVLLLGTMTFAALVAVGAGLWRVAAGPRRLRALVLAMGSLLPPLLWAAVGLYAQAQWEKRQVPNSLPMGLAKVLGV